MNGFTISPTLNKNKVFLIQKSEVEKRLDPCYYVPTLVELERKVLAKHPNKLRDYVVSLSSGATPKTTESEKYYTEKENGIPFLRVQNLSPTGVLEFEDCKYINKETHEGYLKRSQVFENDLLIKITGVGRMAVASVAPENFEGNINQHIVVIRTKDKQTSEILAAFLNSDIGEKLATRRSTGGTRPALDYPALLSIPILNDKRVLEITKKVIELKKRNEIEAENILGEIDNYLLKELGITLPARPENTLKNRIFTTTIKELSGGRFDPTFYTQKYKQYLESILKSKFSIQTIKSCIANFSKGIEIGSKKYVSEGIPFVRVADMDDFGINYESCDKQISKENYNSLKAFYKPRIGEILYSKDGTIGYCTVFTEDNDFIISGGIMRITTQQNISNWFLKYVLSTKLYKELADRVSIGAVIKHLTVEDFFKIPIPVPPLDKQKEIAEHISAIRKEAQQLKDKTKEELKKASEEIEKILLT